jgi:YCII-related domain
MKNFLMLFRNTGGEGRYLSTPEDMAIDMPLWQAWIGQIAMQGKLISTLPIEYQGHIVRKDGVLPGPHGAQQELVVGYLLCHAESPEEVIEWGRTCPILRYPNGSVEVRETLPFDL